MMLRYLQRRSVVPSPFFQLVPLACARFAEGTQPAAPTEPTPVPQEELVTRLYEKLPTAGPKYIRNLRFKKFVEKMERIYLLEREWQRAAEKRDKDFAIFTTSSKAPIHEIFTHYNAHSKSGFSARDIAGCLKGIADVFRVRGPIPYHYFDYDRKETLQSWQMYHLFEDINHGFKLSTLILPHDISKVRVFFWFSVVRCSKPTEQNR